MSCHKFSWYRWFNLLGITLNCIFLVYIIYNDRPKNVNVDKDTINKEIIDSSFSVGGGTWKFSPNTILIPLDVKYNNFENILFLEFTDEKNLELIDKNDNENEKLVRIRATGVIKMIFVSVAGKPVCTSIGVVEFKAKKL